MKTKEEILDEVCEPVKINGEWEFDLFKKENVLEVMDIYATQCVEAIQSATTAHHKAIEILWEAMRIEKDKYLESLQKK